MKKTIVFLLTLFLIVILQVSTMPQAFADDLSDDDGDGYNVIAGDCDDNDANINPDADEVCDGVDNDCDGDVDDDDDDVTDQTTWYADDDGDGYGDATDSQDACDQPADYVDNSTDCDDTDAAITDDQTTFYADDDGDGYGDATSSQDACDQPEGYVEDDTDCDDTNAEANPGETEICDDVDNDCDDEVDEDLTFTTYYLDEDQDGYGNPDESVSDCAEVDGYVEDNTDCDDTDDTIYPDADEVCSDSIDNDCDDDIDEDCDTSGSNTSGNDGDATETEASSSCSLNTIATHSGSFAYLWIMLVSILGIVRKQSS